MPRLCLLLTTRFSAGLGTAPYRTNWEMKSVPI